MRLMVSADGWLDGPAGRVRCALGRGGIRADKREGDGATPAGVFPLLCVWYRADRVSHPRTALPARVIRPIDGWCDDPGDRRYNRPVTLPYAGRHERLWRDDGLYDLLAVIGYNVDPVLAGRGSAIFLHVAKEAYPPTEGCVALSLPDLSRVLALCSPTTVIAIDAAPS